MNKHIEENLNHYMALEAPEYAVLLTGKKGSGKTHFINSYSKNYDTVHDIFFIKISLFGIQTTEAIDKKILFKLVDLKKNSLLSKIISIVANSFAKKVNINVKNIPIEYIVAMSKKNIVFIFDDLERSSIDMSDFFGYIDTFIEKSSNKVIVLANTQDLKEIEKFNTFKEKVIGKVFDIKQDFEATFDTFLEIVPHSKKLLLENKTCIEDIILDSGVYNLRKMRQSILDFDYFYSKLDDIHRKNAKLMHNVLYEFFTLSVGMRSKTLETDKLKIFEASQNFFSLEYVPVLSIEQWKEILYDVKIDEDVINMTLHDIDFSK